MVFWEAGKCLRSVSSMAAASEKYTRDMTWKKIYSVVFKQLLNHIHKQKVQYCSLYFLFSFMHLIIRGKEKVFFKINQHEIMSTYSEHYFLAQLVLFLYPGKVRRISERDTFAAVLTRVFLRWVPVHLTVLRNVEPSSYVRRKRRNCHRNRKVVTIKRESI